MQTDTLQTREPSAVARRGRILCVTSNFPRWEGDSVTPFVLRLVQDLIDIGWEVDVLAPHAENAAVSETLSGVPTERFRYLWPPSLETVCYQGGALVNLRQNRSNYLKLPMLVGSETLAVTRRLLSGKYDLVHAHWILPQGFTCALAAQLTRTPLVVTAHGSDVFALRGRILAGFKRAALRLADAVTANSRFTQDAVLKIYPHVRRIERIPASPAQAAIKPELVTQLRDQYRVKDGPLMIFLGRLVDEKGLGDLLDAVQLLRDDLPSLQLVIAGEGQDRDVFVRQARELGIEDCVHFIGWIDQADVPSYLAAADIFLGPSRKAVDGATEAQGLAFVEAMLAGTPVIATATGGIVESIRHEETGLIVDERSPDQIADAVRTLTEAPGLAAHYADTAQKFALKNLSRQHAAQAYSQLFADLIHGSQASTNEEKSRCEGEPAPELEEQIH